MKTQMALAALLFTGCSGEYTIPLVCSHFDGVADSDGCNNRWPDDAFPIFLETGNKAVSEIANQIGKEYNTLIGREIFTDTIEKARTIIPVIFKEALSDSERVGEAFWAVAGFTIEDAQINLKTQLLDTDRHALYVVLNHEIGHTLGLEHYNEDCSLMNGPWQGCPELSPVQGKALVNLYGMSLDTNTDL